MAFTEVSRQGCVGRLMSSFVGVLIGILMVLLSFPILFWNEGRAVHMAQSLAEGKSKVVTVAADKVDAVNDGKLVHTTGEATTDAELTDQEFAVTTEHALKLKRTVEMFQWKEKRESKRRKKLGGGEETVTTYTYDKVWSDKLIPSSGFKEAGHANPGSMPYESQVTAAQKIQLGAFTLPDSLVKQINNYSRLAVKTIPDSLDEDVKLVEGGYYIGDNSGAPKIGDVRIFFEEVLPGTYSLVAVQKGDTFEAYTAKAGGNEILKIEPGTKTAKEMFEEMETQNTVLTWILRVVGFFVCFFGLCLIAGPAQVLADTIPFVGDLLGLGIGLFAFLIAAALSLVTIAVGWIFYRPLLGIGLLAIAGFLIWQGLKLGKRNRS